MSDLIRRQDAIDAINHICPIDTEYDCALLDRVDVRCVLSDLPSAEPDRKKGEWVEKKDPYGFFDSIPVYPTPQNPDQFKYPYVTWTGGEVTVTNMETKCETPVRDRMVGRI